MPRTPRLAVFLLLGSLALAAPLAAQGGFGGGFGGGGFGGGRGTDLRSALWGLPDVPGGFYVCRLGFTTTASDPSGSGWAIEYPRADINFMLRMSQLTPTDIAGWSDGRSGGIGHTVVRATDPELFRCPYLVMASPGTAGFSDPEIQALRTYLLKGGFLWADDFWGDGPWIHWLTEIQQVLPEYAVVELPDDHPLYSVLYQMPRVPQIPSLNRWRPGDSTQEMAGVQYERPSMHAIADDTGRILVLMTHNTDINDGFEREADMDEFFVEFAWKAYALGVNIALWSLTH